MQLVDPEVFRLLIGSLIALVKQSGGEASVPDNAAGLPGIPEGVIIERDGASLTLRHFVGTPEEARQQIPKGLYFYLKPGPSADGGDAGRSHEGVPPPAEVVRRFIRELGIG